MPQVSGKGKSGGDCDVAESLSEGRAPEESKGRGRVTHSEINSGERVPRLQSAGTASLPRPHHIAMTSINIMTPVPSPGVSFVPSLTLVI